MLKVVAPMQSVVVRFEVAERDSVNKGQPLVILEAMKMEHLISAERAGVVDKLVAKAGVTVAKGEVLLRLEYTGTAEDVEAVTVESAPSAAREDLAAFLERSLSPLGSS
jgi:3-methylcrotonyl-CoA carboxylase alpha subunit